MRRWRAEGDRDGDTDRDRGDRHRPLFHLFLLVRLGLSPAADQLSPFTAPIAFVSTTKIIMLIHRRREERNTPCV